MIKLASTSLVAAALGLGLTLAAGSAFAQAECDPKKEKCPPPKEPAACSPGFYKQPHHLGTWCGIAACPSGNGDAIPESECAGLVEDLNLPGGNQDRIDAVNRLNACFGTADLSPCDD